MNSESQTICKRTEEKTDSKKQKTNKTQIHNNQGFLRSYKQDLLLFFYTTRTLLPDIRPSYCNLSHTNTSFYQFKCTLVWLLKGPSANISILIQLIPKSPHSEALTMLKTFSRFQFEEERINTKGGQKLIYPFFLEL